MGGFWRIVLPRLHPWGGGGCGGWALAKGWVGPGRCHLPPPPSLSKGLYQGQYMAHVLREWYFTDSHVCCVLLREVWRGKLSLPGGRREGKIKLSARKVRIDHINAAPVPVEGKRSVASTCASPAQPWGGGYPMNSARGRGGEGSRGDPPGCVSLCLSLLPRPAALRLFEGSLSCLPPVPQAAEAAGGAPEDIDAVRSFCEALMIMRGSTHVPDRTCGACGAAMERPLRCSRCKVTVYCGRECQKRAWKTHKKECARLERDCEAQQKEAGRALSEGALSEGPERPPSTRPVDYSDEGPAVFDEAVRALRAGHFEAAAERFCYALFLDFSLDAALGDGGYVDQLKARVQPPSVPVRILLLVVGNGAGLGAFRAQDWEELLQQLPDPVPCAAAPSPDPNATASHPLVSSDAAWAKALVHVLCARFLARAASSTMQMSLNGEAKRHLLEAQRLIGGRGYLTMLFDLGWVHRDVMEFDAARRYYDQFLKAAPATHPLRGAAEQAMQSVGVYEMMLNMGTMGLGGGRGGGGRSAQVKGRRRR